MKRKDRNGWKVSGEKPEHPRTDSQPSPRVKGRGEEDTYRKVHVEAPVIFEFSNSLTKQKKAERNEDSRDHRKQLRWTKIGSFLVLVYTIASLVQVYFTRQALKSTERFATLEQRPYIAATGQPNIFSGPDSSIESSAIIMKNYGKSPAIRVLSVGQIISASGMNFDETDRWFNEMGLPLRIEYDSSSGMYKMPNGVKISQETMMQSDTKPEGATALSGARPKPPAIFVGRVEYYDTIGTFYWTDFCYIIGTRSDSPAPITFRCPKHNEIH